MAGLALHFFGFPQVTRNGAPVELRRRKEIALLAYLAVTQRAHSRDSLAALLWPGYDQTSARGNLRRTLSNLNRKLEAGWLDIDHEQVALPPQTGLWIDVVSFQSHMDRCRRTDEPCPNCLAPLHAAIDLYTDDFLTGFSLVDAPEFGVWQVQEAERLRREYAQALHKLAQCLADSGDYAEVLAYARRWLELDPLHEPAHRMLMHLHARSGDRSAAVHQYEECVQVLASELGMQPEPETIALYEQIRSGEATGEAVPQQVWSRSPSPAQPARADHVFHRPIGGTGADPAPPGRSPLPAADHRWTRRHRQNAARHSSRRPTPRPLPGRHLFRRPDSGRFTRPAGARHPARRRPG